MKMGASTVRLAGARPRTGFSEAMAAWFGRRVADMRAHAEYRRDIAVLRELDDRLLRDAGLTRYDVQKGFSRWR